MLTEDQVIACLSHEGDRVAMLNAAYRMGMMRAAEVCEEQSESATIHKAMIENGKPVYDHAMIDFACGALDHCRDAIRAEAGSTSEPRKGE